MLEQNPTKITEEPFNKAESLAIEAVNSTTHPTQATTILLKLARRTTQDFNLPARTLHIWKSLSTDRKQWLWSENREFWEFMSMVLRAAY